MPAFALLLPFLVAAAGHAAQPSGLEIMRRVHARDSGRQARMVLHLTLTDERRDTVLERDVELLRRRTETGYRSRFTVLAPEKAAGLAVLLVEEEPESKIWLYFPASREKTEILTRGLSALGSDFACEDLRLIFPPSDYEFATLGREMVGGHACWKVEMKPRTAALQRALGFARAVGWVRDDAALIVRADFFDAYGQLSKTFRSDAPVLIDGVWTLRRYSMISLRTHHRTDVVVTAVDYSGAVDPRKVDPQHLGD